MIKNELGFSLVELLICIAILAILLGLAIPGYSSFVQKNRANQVINQLSHAINLGRSTAIITQRMVTFCRSEDGLSCGGNWQDGSILFTDQNADREINGDDQLILHIPMLELPGTLKWRSFQNRQYLQLTPLGFTNYQNGNFTYCPENNDATLAQQIVISRTGRIRLAIDYDGDGLREDSKGKPLKCD